MREYEEMRGTGRTTGLMLKAIGEASLNPMNEVEFIDHHRATLDRARCCRGSLLSKIRFMNLYMTVRLDGKRVFLKSQALEVKQDAQKLRGEYK